VEADEMSGSKREKGPRLDSFGYGTTISATTARLVDAAVEIQQDPATRPDFLHGILCQVGLPRSKVDGTTFERRSGNASLRIKAGELWDGKQWQPQPIPFGTRPRLALIHVSSEAVRTRSPVVEVGRSIREFLGRLGLDASGREYATFKRQMNALAACEMRLGLGTSTLRVQPIEEFEAWLHPTGSQAVLWPGVLRLSDRFFESLSASAVPLDPRALAALSHSALALDCYAWMAQRLHRIEKPAGVKLSWSNLAEQFGSEYADRRNFKRKFRVALREALALYPDAKVEPVPGGLVLRPSPPPIRKALLQVRALAK
jgi:hypothetical protein